MDVHGGPQVWPTGLSGRPRAVAPSTHDPSPHDPADATGTTCATRADRAVPRLVSVTSARAVVPSATSLHARAAGPGGTAPCAGSPVRLWPSASRRCRRAPRGLHVDACRRGCSSRGAQPDRAVSRQPPARPDRAVSRRPAAQPDRAVSRRPAAQPEQLVRGGPPCRHGASGARRPCVARRVRSAPRRLRAARRAVAERPPRCGPRRGRRRAGRVALRRSRDLRGGRRRPSAGGRHPPRRAAVHARARRSGPRRRHRGRRGRDGGNPCRRGVLALRARVVPPLGCAPRGGLPRPAGPARGRRTCRPAPAPRVRLRRSGRASRAGAPSRRCASARCATPSRRAPCRSRRGSCPRSSRGRA